MSERDPVAEEATPEHRKSPWSIAFRIATWILAAGCFYLVYTKIEEAALAKDLNARQYLVGFFGDANWLFWLALMIPYSVFFFMVDSHVTWRVVRWFNAPELKFTSMLPIRASAYILSLVNEQVGKGAMTLYLLRHHKVPGWRALSSMILLGLMEIFQLLLFSAIGVALNFHLVVDASTQWPLDIILPAVMIFAFVYLPLHIAYFRTGEGGLREKPILTAFRQARPVHYFLIVLFKAPNLIGAVIVYTFALDLFQVEVSLGQMLAFLPVIFLAAALPLPFHAGALVLWTVLFPDYPEVAAFSLVMHTFFVVFNATIGLMFLPRANRELFG
ncbi:MAG: hypothetical protein OXU77_16505 [Gammaproteobacteria bacterium]|nr:hypothetical protein [Gammaproteobacteria bacterium]